MEDPTSHSNGALPESILAEAALWLARRDRGLTREEQDPYFEWLRADPRHAEALKRCAATLQRMMRLYEWQPNHTAQPNADLFAPIAKRLAWWRPALVTAAAGAVFFAWPHLLRQERQPKPPEGNYLLVNERIALPDGSGAELKEDCHLLVQYSDHDRRVRLTRGEAHFTVLKDARRPFLVEVAGINVVAVGTSFSVRWEAAEVEVLVTSGTVRLETESAPAAGAPEVTSGERATVARRRGLETAVPVPTIEAVTPVEMARALAWLTPRLKFHETPLAEAVQQFNALNRHQIVLGDPSLAELRIGGTFRPDNVAAFVRLLEVTFRLRADKGDYETVLRKGL